MDLVNSAHAAMAGQSSRKTLLTLSLIRRAIIANKRDRLG